MSRSSKIRTPSAGLKNQRFHQVEVFGSSHVRRFDRSNKNMHLELRFHQHYGWQKIKIFRSSTDTCSLKKSNFDENCFTFEQSLHSVLWTPWKIGQCKITDLLILPKNIVILSFQILSIFFESQKCSANVHNKIQLVCIKIHVWKWIFLPTYKVFFQARIFIPGISFFIDGN